MRQRSDLFVPRPEGIKEGVLTSLILGRDTGFFELQIANMCHITRHLSEHQRTATTDHSP